MKLFHKDKNNLLKKRKIKKLQKKLRLKKRE